MDKTIIKKLNKNFEKTWKTLSLNEKQECISYMKKTLKEAEGLYKDSLIKLNAIRPELQAMITEDMKKEISYVEKTIDLITGFKFGKEDRLQEKILLSDNPQLLFSDIVASDENYNKADSLVFGILTQANQAIKHGATKDVIITLNVQTDFAIKVFERYGDVCKKQTQKIDALFPAFAKDDQKEVTL